MVFQLHAVIIHKPIPLDQARQISQEFIKNPNRTFFRETGESYRFRNIPKTKFRQFRSQVINPNITLVYGNT